MARARKELINWCYLPGTIFRRAVAFFPARRNPAATHAQNAYRRVATHTGPLTPNPSPPPPPRYLVSIRILMRIDAHVSLP